MLIRTCNKSLCRVAQAFQIKKYFLRSILIRVCPRTSKSTPYRVQWPLRILLIFLRFNWPPTEVTFYSENYFPLQFPSWFNRHHLNKTHCSHIKSPLCCLPRRIAPLFCTGELQSADCTRAGWRNISYQRGPLPIKSDFFATGFCWSRQVNLWKRLHSRLLSVREVHRKSSLVQTSGGNLETDCNWEGANVFMLSHRFVWCIW